MESPNNGVSGWSRILKIYIFWKILFIFKYLFIFRERGRDGERKGEKCQCVAISHVAPTGDLARNPGMCPDLESNQWPFGSQSMLNPLSYTSQGCLYIFREREREGEREVKNIHERETSISCFLNRPGLGTELQPRPVPWLGNWTSDPSLCRTPNQLSHTSQGRI